ncbi:MAG TPA: hypothetical protein VIK14_11905 [Ignavibacteria bacterium]
MNKEEFLIKQTRDVIEIFEKYGNITPIFSILYDDGSTDSFATDLGSDLLKGAFSFFMRSVCKDPRVIASIFKTTGWISSQADKENKRPSECADREETVMAIYNTRDHHHKMLLYKKTKNSKLKLETSINDFGGRFGDPFYNGGLTKEEKAKAIEDFQEYARETLCYAFEKFDMMTHMIFFLEDTPEQVCILRITEEEWNNKYRLSEIIQTKCYDVETLAFLMAYPMENEMVDIIQVAEDLQMIYHYRMDHSNRKLEFENSETYNGEYSDYLKSDIKIIGTKDPFGGPSNIQTFFKI